MSNPAIAAQLSCGLVHQEGASCCGKWCIATSEYSDCGTGNDMKLSRGRGGGTRREREERENMFK